MQTVDANYDNYTLVDMDFGSAPQVNSHAAVDFVSSEKHSLEKSAEFFFAFLFTLCFTGNVRIYLICLSDTCVPFFFLNKTIKLLAYYY